LDYPRDLIGYGANVPRADWPGNARVAVQFVLNYEEGGESCVLHGDQGSEQFLSGIIGAAAYPARHLTMRAAAAPSAPAWQARWERAVEHLGVPVHRMPSGAGHDAMQLHEVMPQAMLFMRGLNAGISHNPLEAITNDDTELCVRAFQNLLDELATAPS